MLRKMLLFSICMFSALFRLSSSSVEVGSSSASFLLSVEGSTYEEETTIGFSTTYVSFDSNQVSNITSPPQTGVSLTTDISDAGEIVAVLESDLYVYWNVSSLRALKILLRSGGRLSDSWTVTVDYGNGTTDELDASSKENELVLYDHDGLSSVYAQACYKLGISAEVWTNSSSIVPSSIVSQYLYAVIATK